MSIRARTRQLPRCLSWLAVTVFALPACAIGAGGGMESLPVRELRGHFTSGPGASWFRPCGATAADAAWWVTVTDRAVGQVAAARDERRLRDGIEVYVRWRAAVTTGGEVGPRGEGAPALLVREVLELRTAGAEDCAAE